MDLTRQRFGKLTVLKREPSSPDHRANWLCGCDCGRTKIVRQDYLKSGKAESCGCLHRARRLHALLKHGAARGQCRNQTREYRAWAGMISRTTTRKEEIFRYYGRRGITVCEEWRKSFPAFLAHIGPKPSSRHSLDRINNDGNYEPGNVRWATPKEQAQNRRTTKRKPG